MNNSAAIGYMILSLKALGYDNKKIKEAEAEMKYQMDMKTEKQAERIYNNF